MNVQQFTTHSADETTALGRHLAKQIVPPKLILLTGDLGAGKTTLVKGTAAGFGAANEDEVTSPTFTLVHEYRGPTATLFHIDLYRVDTQRELETLGLDDLMTEDSIVLIEWGEKFPRLVDECDLQISIEKIANIANITNNERLIRLGIPAQSKRRAGSSMRAE